MLEGVGHIHEDSFIGMIALSDLLTAVSYFFIPVILALFIYQHRDLKFKSILVLFILFIFACGFQHLLHFTSRWWPAPLLLTGAMIFMAVISVVTAVMIIPVLRRVTGFMNERAVLQEKLASRNLELESALNLANENKMAHRQSEEAFRRIISDAPIGMAVVSLDGTFSLVNRSLCDMLGYKFSELKKMKFQDITHPEDLDTDLFQVSLLLEGTSENYRIEKRYICKNGDVIQVQLDVSLVRNESHNPKFFVSQIQDITAKNITQEALRASRHHFHSLLMNLPTAVVVHRPDSSIEYANPAASRLLELSEDQLTGKTAVDPYWHFLSEEGGEMSLDDYPVMKVISSKRPLINYLVGVMSSKDTPVRWVLVNAFPLKSPAGALDRIIVSFIDITQQKNLQQALEEQAQTDPLTGLFNRRYFSEAAERELKQRNRTLSPLSLLALDIDHFKQVNDKYGHSVGDLVLLKLRDVIREVVREIDIVCRTGGEEFVILMPNTDNEQAVRVAERLRARVCQAECHTKDPSCIKFTISIGIASLSDGEASIDDVIERADSALYRAKEDGRNCIRIAE